jgi:hypothetical protein
MNNESVEKLARDTVAAMLAQKRIPFYFAGLATELMVASFIRGAAAGIASCTAMLAPICEKQG